jgi:hypothetical protein
MKKMFTLVEKSGDPSHLTPLEIALSRCSWLPSELHSEASSASVAETTQEGDAALPISIGNAGEEFLSMRSESHGPLSKLLESHLLSGSLSSSRFATGLLDSQDCTMELIDSMPSAEGLLLCVLIRQGEPTSISADDQRPRLVEQV